MIAMFQSEIDQEDIEQRHGCFILFLSTDDTQTLEHHQGKGIEAEAKQNTDRHM